MLIDAYSHGRCKGHRRNFTTLAACRLFYDGYAFQPESGKCIDSEGMKTVVDDMEGTCFCYKESCPTPSPAPKLSKQAIAQLVNHGDVIAGYKNVEAAWDQIKPTNACTGKKAPHPVLGPACAIMGGKGFEPSSILFWRKKICLNHDDMARVKPGTGAGTCYVFG